MDLLKITKTHVYIPPEANHAAILKKSRTSVLRHGEYSLCYGHSSSHTETQLPQTPPNPPRQAHSPGASQSRQLPTEPSRAGEGGGGGGSRGAPQERPSGTSEASQPSRAHLPHGNLRKSLLERPAAQGAALGSRRGQHLPRSTPPAPLPRLGPVKWGKKNNKTKQKKENLSVSA